MVIFKKKRIISGRSLGEDLARERKKLNLTLSVVERKIGVGEGYLEAMESGEWKIIPGEVYAKNWLKKYVIFLGLNWQSVKKKYDREVGNKNFWPQTQKQKFGISQKRLLVFPKIIRNALIGLVVLIIVLYLSFQIYSLLRPPILEIIYPPHGLELSNRNFKLLGKSESGAVVSINGNPVPIDKDGWFKIDINLNKGLNEIKIQAKKSYGRENEKQISVVVKEN